MVWRVAADQGGSAEHQLCRAGAGEGDSPFATPSPVLTKGGSFEVPMTAPGCFWYACGVYRDMVGCITVVASPALVAVGEEVQQEVQQPVDAPDEWTQEREQDEAQVQAIAAPTPDSGLVRARSWRRQSVPGMDEGEDDGDCRRKLKLDGARRAAACAQSLAANAGVVVKLKSRRKAAACAVM